MSAHGHSGNSGETPDPSQKRERPQQKGGAESMPEIKKEQLNNDLNCDISALPGQQMCGPSAEEMLSFMQAHDMIDVDSVANAMKQKEIER